MPTTVSGSHLAAAKAPEMVLSKVSQRLWSPVKIKK